MAGCQDRLREPAARVSEREKERERERERDTPCSLNAAPTRCSMLSAPSHKSLTTSIRGAQIARTSPNRCGNDPNALSNRSLKTHTPLIKGMEVHPLN